MSSNVEKNVSLTEFVSEEQFNETIKTLLNERNDNEKPLWTRERIEEAITVIQQFKLAPLLKQQRTNKQYYYANKYDVMEVGTTKFLILKRKSDSDAVVKIVPMENFYHVLRETHQSTGHGGRDKMLYSLKSKYLIPFSVVLEFLKLCTVCQCKKKFPRKGIVVCPIVSSDFNHRGQVDLVDLQSTPDRNYKWLLHYQDHATKFSFLRPLTSKRAAEVAVELLKIFLEVGCPHILQSDNGREFTAAIIQELTSLWPSCKVVNGRPRHPASQGSVERSNQDVEAMLRAWLIDNDSKNWAIGCYFVQFQKNSSFHRTIKRSPYKALFGADPRTGLESSHIPKELLEKLVNEEDLDLLVNQQDHNSIVTPEDLPAVTSKNTNDTLSSKDLPSSGLSDHNASIVNDNTSMSQDLSAADLIIEKALKLQNVPEIESSLLSTTKQLEPLDDSPSITDSICKSEEEPAVNDSEVRCVVCGMESSGAHLCDICTNPVHAICGKTEEEGYGSKMTCFLCQKEESIKDQRENAVKHMKRSAEKMKEVSSKKFRDVLVGSTVLVDVPKVDRGPLDGNNIVGIILGVKNNLYQVGTSVGIIKDWLPRNALQIATTTFTETVPQTNLSLREIAGKLSLFGGQGFKKCSCEQSKVQCRTRRCACKKNNVLCNSRCHKSTTCCNKN